MRDTFLNILYTLAWWFSNEMFFEMLFRKPSKTKTNKQQRINHRQKLEL